MFLVQLCQCPSTCGVRGVPTLIPVNVFASNGVASSSRDLQDLSGPTDITEGINGFFEQLECNGHELCVPPPCPPKPCPPNPCP